MFIEREISSIGLILDYFDFNSVWRDRETSHPSLLSTTHQFKHAKFNPLFMGRVVFVGRLVWKSVKSNLV